MSQLVCAQEKTVIDSLLKRVKQIKNDINIVDIYNELSYEYLSINIDSSLYYHNIAIEKAKKIKYKNGIATAHKNRGEQFLKLDSYRLAKYYFQKSADMFLSLEDTNSVAKINYLCGNTYYYSNNYDSAIIFYEKSNYFAKKINDLKQIADTYKAIGKMYWIKGDMIKALVFYKKSLPIAKSINDTSLTCVLYNNIGVIYLNVADYDKALEYYYLSLSLRDSLNDVKGKSLTLNNIGIIFSAWDRDDEAYKYYEQASLLCNDLDYPFGTAYSFYNLGNHYLKMDMLDSATISFKQAMSNYSIINNLNGVSICYEKLGIIYEIRGEHKSAMFYFNKMLSIADSVNNLNNKASALFDIANLYYHKNNFREALKYAHKSNLISEDNNYRKLCNKNYELLADIHKKSGNYKKALDYYLIANQYKDSIFNEEKSRQITQMQILHKTAQKEQENIALKKEQEKQLAQSEADRTTIRFQSTVVFATITLLVLVLIFALIFYREKQKLKTANNTKNKLFSIIGHDLRGPLGNFKGLIDLLLLDDEVKDPKKINSLLKLMQKTASSNYDLLENLLSWSGTKSGNIEYRPQKLNLRNLINSVFEHNEYNAQIKSIQLISEVEKDIFVLADDIMLHTIIRNLVLNAIKFTNKNGAIIVSSKKKPGKHRRSNKNIENFIEITVSDNGIGINQEILPRIFADNEFYSTSGTGNEKGTGLGLKLCKEFVEKHKGEIRVESEANKGSDFIFTIPEYKE